MGIWYPFFLFMGKMLAEARAELTEHVLTHSDLFDLKNQECRKAGCGSLGYAIRQGLGRQYGGQG